MPLFSQISLFICSLHGRMGGPRPGLIREEEEKKESLLLGIKLKPTACPCPGSILAPYYVMYFPFS